MRARTRDEPSSIIVTAATAVQGFKQAGIARTILMTILCLLHVWKP